MAGKIQNADIKSLVELTGKGATKTELLNTDKMYSLKSDNILENTLRKNNYSAIIDPTVTDDFSKKYEDGSIWINTVSGAIFTCVNNGIGAAVWEQGGDGGVGSSSIFGLLNADNDDIADWTETGTGTFTFNEVTPIHGDVDYKFITSALNDKIERTIVVDPRSQDKYISCKFQYKLDLVGVVASIYDGATLLERLELEVATSITGAVIETQLTGVTNLTIRFEAESFSAAQTLIFDDIEFDDDPSEVRNLVSTTLAISKDLTIGNVTSSFTAFNQDSIEGDLILNSGGVVIQDTGTYKVVVSAEVYGNNDSINLGYTVNGTPTIGMNRRTPTDAAGSTAQNEETFIVPLIGGDILKPGYASAVTRSWYAGQMIISRVEEAAHVVQASEMGEIGSIQAFGTTETPSGFTYCDGSEVSRTGVYEKLFSKIGTNYGIGDGTTTFNLPDLRGEFLRGQDDGSGNDPDAATRTGGDAVGSTQADEIKSHAHTKILAAQPAGSGNGTPQSSQSLESERPTTNGAFGGSETRPRNVSVRYFIRHEAYKSFVAIPIEQNLNDYALNSDASGNVTQFKAGSGNITVTRNSLGIFTVDYSALGLTFNPIVSAKALFASHNRCAYVWGIPSTTQAIIHTSDGATTNSFDLPFSFFLSKSGADSTLPTGIITGKFAPIRTAYIKDVKASGVVSATVTAGSYITRELNTISGDSEIIKSLSSNQFVLGAGKYKINSDVGGYRAGKHKGKLYNVTDLKDQVLGKSAQIANTEGGNTVSVIKDVFEIFKDTTFEIRQRTEANSTEQACGFGDNEIYTPTGIEKLR